MRLEECKVGQRVRALWDIAEQENHNHLCDRIMDGKTGTIVWTTNPRYDDGIYEICVEFDAPHDDLDEAGMLWECNDLTPIGNGRYGYAVSVELICDDDETEVTGLEELLHMSRKGGA